MSELYKFASKDRWHEEALRILFENNYDRIYRLALSISLDNDMAKDITQETFLRAFMNFSKLRDREKFEQWLNAIAINVCKYMLKKRNKLNMKSMSIYDEDGALMDYILSADGFETPDMILENKELMKEPEKCMDDFDDDEKRIIFLKYHEDCTFGQISSIIDIKEGTIRMKYHRLKKRIVDRMNTYFTDTEGRWENV
jgi:RNA polymerase sigma-70 factor (ECF subfamily)